MKKNNTDSPSKVNVSMIPLHSANEFGWTKEGARPPARSTIKFDTVNELKLKLKKFGGYTAKRIEPYLSLSGKQTYVPNKGYLNALGCHSIFANDPNISFLSYPSENKGPGKLELWINGLTTHQKLTAEIRLSGYSYDPSGAYEVRSSMAQGLYGYFPVQANSKIDLYFPDVYDVSGQGLITVEPVDMIGSWIFFDAKVNVID